MLKSQTVEKERARRRKRGLNAPDSDRSIFDTIESVVSGGGGGGSSSADNSMENDPDALLEDDDEMLPPPTPANVQHKDGDVIKPLPDGRLPETPEGRHCCAFHNDVL